MGAALTKGRARIIVGVVVVVLLAAVLGMRTLGHSSAGAAAKTTPSTLLRRSTTSTTANANADAMEAAAKEVEPFVEKTRGLKFTRPVKVTLLDDLTFKARLLGYYKPDKAEVDRTTGVMRALGFVPAGFDLTKAESDGAAASVVGFYDPITKDLVVKGAKVTPYVKEVLAHELTHALDDQHFTLVRPALVADDPDERIDTFKALSEGDATHVQLAYYDAMSAADKASADHEEDSYGVSSPQNGPVAPALGDFSIYPYAFGYHFVDQVLKDKGQATLDAAFANPPISSAEILVPKRYYYGMGGQSGRITAPVADKQPIIDRGVLGQFGLFVMLRQTMGDDLALVAASTWEGDRYVAWRDGDKTCVKLRFLTESVPSEFPLALLLKDWVDQQGGGTVEEPGTVLLTTCR